MDFMSVAASITVLVTDATQSAEALSTTVKKFRDLDATLKRLQDELESLKSILTSLQEVSYSGNSILMPLKGPVSRCSRLCREFEISMKEFSGESETGPRYWPKMRFKRGNIHDFIDTLSVYKSTISIGLGLITIHPSEISHQSLGKYKKMIMDTTYTLTTQLQHIDEDMVLSTSEVASTSDTSVDLRDEREGVKLCLRVCEEAGTYIGSLMDREPSLRHKTTFEPTIHHVYTALSVAAKTIQKDHPSLMVRLPRDPTYATILDECAKAAGTITSSIWIPPVPPSSEVARQRIRDFAQQNRDMWEAKTRETEAIVRPIYAHGLLETAYSPKELTREERAQVKEKFLGDYTNDSGRYGPAKPYVIIEPRLESTLPCVECTLSLSAVDHDEGMPQDCLKKVVALWDTGAETTFITDDQLSLDFKNFLDTDAVHAPYRSGDSTTVQVSCLVEFSNRAVVQIDTIATILPSSAVPNNRSGVILGQNGLINCLRYESASRSILEMEGLDMSEEYWGTFDFKCYRGIDGELRRC